MNYKVKIMIEPLKNSNSNISFQRKLPMERCEITDKKTNKKISAVFCEYDCKDIEDMQDFENRCSDNILSKDVFLYQMGKKFDQEENSNHHFYTLETTNGDIAALAHTETKGPIQKIIDLDSNKKRYESSDKSILSLIGKNMIYFNKGKKIKAQNPTTDEAKFYTSDCGFKYNQDNELYLDKKGMEDLYIECGGRNFNRKIDVFC